MDVLIADSLEPEVLGWLSARHGVHCDPALAREPSAFRRHLPQARAVVVPALLALDAPLMARAPLLRCVGRLTPSVDNIDVAACSARGIEIVRPSTAATVAEAEFAVGALLQMLRRVPVISPEGLLVGRELQKEYGQEPQCILTMPLLVGLDGVEKMSKSKDNYVAITEPGNTMFAKLMSISDDLMWNYFELLSFRDLSEIVRFKHDINSGRNPREIKVLLAKEIVSRFHDTKAAEQAEYDFNLRAKGGIPDDIAEISLSGAPLGIATILKSAQLVPSTSEAMRMVEQGGVRVDGSAVSDKGLKLVAGTYVVQVGKRKFARVSLQN